MKSNKNVIYCYTNKINRNSYVGQTNCEARRYREHRANHLNKNSLEYDSLIHKKMREYGFDNFEYEVLEEVSDEKLLNEREIYWIKEKKSFVLESGYNLTKGGNNSFNETDRERNVRIIEMIKRGINYSEIAIIEKVSFSLISNINSGLIGKIEGESYPIKRFYREDSFYDNLIDDLRYSNDSYKKLASRYNISESTVKKINYGKLRPGLSKEYPIRQLSGVKAKANIIKQLLRDTDLSEKEIAAKAEVSEITVFRINTGETHFSNKEKYPIRNL